MKQPSRHYLVACFALLGACGSAAPQVQSAVERDTDYSRYHTFAVTRETVDVEGIPGGDAQAAQRVRAALVHAFEARGLRETEASEADLSVEFAVRGVARTTSFAMVHGTATAPITFVDGALAVFVSERASQQLLWTGYTSNEWIRSGENRAQVVVDAIMREFPQ